MLPKNNRRFTAEEMLEQCRRNRQEARILEGRDRPYVIDAPSAPNMSSAPALTSPEPKAS